VCQRGGTERSPEKTFLGEASTIGLFIAKRVFLTHGIDTTGRVVFRKRLMRAKVLEFFAGKAPCLMSCSSIPAAAQAWAL
jgi:hypothetical protein